MKQNDWNDSPYKPAGRSSTSTMTWSLTSIVKYSLLFLHLFIIPANRVEAGCNTYNTLIKCKNSMITDEELTKSAGANDLHVQNYVGSLTSSGKVESEISSIQFQDSTIDRIQPQFFYLLSNGNLQYLILNRVSGSFRLNSETLGGLESVLTRLEVNDHELQDMGNIGGFGKLEMLKLVRTGITEMPKGFEQVVNHLVELDVSNNKLTSLPWDELAKRLKEVDFRALRVGKNKWHCDCRMRSLVMADMQAKKKVSGLKCSSPPELLDQTLDTLSVGDICTAAPEPEPTQPPAGGGGEVKPSVAPSSSGDESQKDKQQPGADGTPEVASAGSTVLSTEVIAVIVAVCVVVLLIISAVIAYKVRQRNARRKSAGGKPSTFQSNSYCAVVENPEEGRMKHSSKMAGHSRGNHGVEEREPLAGTGYHGRYPDSRL